MLLMMVGTSLSGVLASSIVTYSNSREKTIAQQLAMDQIEAIRRMPFSSVGLPNRHPSGTLQAQRPDDVTGLHAKLNLQITYVDDQTPNAYRTYAKKRRRVTRCGLRGCRSRRPLVHVEARRRHELPYALPRQGRVDAAVGRHDRDGQNNECASTLPANCAHGTMIFTGSTATYGGGCMSMFATRVYQYDPTLLYLQPPWFPTLGDSLTTLMFREMPA